MSDNKAQDPYGDPADGANISLLPLSLVDLTLFPHLCTVPLVEELTSDVALIKLKKRRLNKITKDFWIFGKNIFKCNK